MLKTVNTIGFRSAMLACLSTVAYLIVQLLQMYGILNYPMDEILIYSTSLCIVIPFLLMMLALHHMTAGNRKFWSMTAASFSILYAMLASANYVVQLATVIPHSLNGKLEEIRVLQQIPHSLFWNFDAMAYIFMGFACCAAFPLFENKGFHRWVRYALLGNASVTPLIAVVYFYPKYSYDLLVLGFPWAVTAPAAMLTLGLYFRRNHVNMERMPSAAEAVR